MSFSKLGLQPTLLELLAQHNYQQATPVQIQAIPLILEGNDVMARAQTGTGKTAAFALPIIQLLDSLELNTSQLQLNDTIAATPKALVLLPTRELAQQIQASFERYAANSSLRSVMLYGGASLNTQIKQLKVGCDIAVATPGRLIDLVNQGEISLGEIQHLVLDEADRMLDMGFIDDIQWILKKVPTNRQTLLFSATFDDEIFKLRKTIMRDEKIIEIDTKNTAATAIEQTVYTVDPDKKQPLLAFLIGSRNWQQVLVFTRTKQGADDLVKEFSKDGLKAMAIHGDKSQGARDRSLELFKAGEIRILVATDVAARGIDIQQLEFVINYELPYNAEDYIHRIGRTGRAGQTGHAISLVSTEEEYLLKQIEELLDTTLGQQWFQGFEPDLDRPIGSLKGPRPKSAGRQKQEARQRSIKNQRNRKRGR